MTLRRSAIVGGFTLAALVAVAILVIGALWLVQRGEALPNTTVVGIDVGGLAEDEVRSALAPAVSAREDAPVTFTFEDEEHRVLASELGFRVDVDATTEQVMRRGRTGLPGDVAERLRSLRTTREVALVTRQDDDAVEAWVTALADGIDRERSTGAVEVDPDTLEVTVTAASGSVEVQRDVVTADLRGALGDPDGAAFELAVETAPQPVSDEALEEVAEQVRRAVSGPLELRSGDASLTLEPRDIARLVRVDELTDGDEITLELVVDADEVDAVMGEVATGRFAREAIDASFTADRSPPASHDEQGSTSFEPVEASVDIEEGQQGARFDAEVAAEQLQILLRDGARTAELRLETIEPELSNERAQELRPTHLLGTFTTYFTAGEARSHNIRRLADTIDGAVVLPGDQFSINGISGQRTCEKGYLEAGTIIQGELVPTCGGGTSQFGTTTFNAAFFAGLQLDQWKAHSWYISRYPMGREATLSYPELDVRFTNTTDGAVLVKTSHTDSSVTVSIYGRPIASRVSATHGPPTDETVFSTERREDRSLSPGDENILQPGAGGFTVEVVRTVELLGGGEDTQTIRTVYVPQTRIVEHGPSSGSSSDDADEDDTDDDADDD